MLYDRVFEDIEHEHMGIVIEAISTSIVAAEGNYNNVSAVVEKN